MAVHLGYVFRAGLLALVAGQAMAFDGRPGQSDPPMADEVDTVIERSADQPPAIRRTSGATIDALRAAIAQCWNTSPTSDTPVLVRVVMNRDGTVASAELADTGDDANPEYQEAAQIALRAVLNPHCQPWPLPAETWPSWQYMELNFDPRAAF